MTKFDLFDARGAAKLSYVALLPGAPTIMERLERNFLMPQLKDAPRHYARTGIGFSLLLCVGYDSHDSGLFLRQEGCGVIRAVLTLIRRALCFRRRNPLREETWGWPGR